MALAHQQQDRSENCWVYFIEPSKLFFFRRTDVFHFFTTFPVKYVFMAIDMDIMYIICMYLGENNSKRHFRSFKKQEDEVLCPCCVTFPMPAEMLWWFWSVNRLWLKPHDCHYLMSGLNPHLWSLSSPQRTMTNCLSKLQPALFHKSRFSNVSDLVYLTSKL